MESNNQIFQFTTNINCGGCVATVTPFLNDAKRVSHWKVDTQHKDKVLTVKSEGITEWEIIETVRKAGFKIELLNS